MDPRLTPLAAILDLNTHLFGNCLDGLSDEQAAGLSGMYELSFVSPAGLVAHLSKLF